MPKYLLFIVCFAFGSQPVCAQTSSAGGQDDRIYTGGQRISQATTEIPVAVFSGDPSQFSIDDNQITVTATGGRSEVEDTGQAVTIIGRDEIEEVQGADLTRVLERAPGVTFSRNGGVGGFTVVRVRGAEAEQLLVIIDGVRVADPASPVGEHVELFGRVENLFDAEYQTVAGYGSSGRGAFVGARTKF